MWSDSVSLLSQVTARYLSSPADPVQTPDQAITVDSVVSVKKDHPARLLSLYTEWMPRGLTDVYDQM